jgi:hypothetical protein
MNYRAGSEKSVSEFTHPKRESFDGGGVEKSRWTGDKRCHNLGTVESRVEKDSQKLVHPSPDA